MLKVSNQLKSIAQDLNVQYLRANNINEANLLTHYRDNYMGMIIYVGHGEQDNTFEGAQPLTKVEVEVYCLVKKFTIDQEAGVVDVQLDEMAQVAADVIHQFNGERDITQYRAQAVEVFDDIFIGYLLTFEAILSGKNCHGGGSCQ